VELNRFTVELIRFIVELIRFATELNRFTIQRFGSAGELTGSAPYPAGRGA
jgi:hypothetical protein